MEFQDIDYVGIVLNGYFNKGASSVVLEAYYVRAFKKAANEEFCEKEEFFSGCLNVVQALISDIERRMNERKIDVYRMIAMTDDQEAIKELRDELETPKLSFNAFLPPLTKNRFVGNLSFTQIKYISDALSNAFEKVSNAGYKKSAVFLSNEPSKNQSQNELTTKKNLQDYTLWEFLELISDYGEVKTYTVLIKAENEEETEVRGRLSDFQELARDHPSNSPLRKFVDEIEDSIDHSYTELEIYRYLKKATSGFQEDEVRIVLREMDLFEFMYLHEDMNCIAEKEYIKNGWSIPTYKEEGKIPWKGSKEVTPIDYDTMRRKVFSGQAIGWHFYIAFGLLSSKLKSIEKQKSRSQSDRSSSKVHDIDKQSKKELNLFCAGMPLDTAREFLRVLTTKRSKNGKPFLTKSQFDTFFEKAFLGKGGEGQAINMMRGESGAIKALFHRFYQKAKEQSWEATSHCLDKYRRLVSDSFTNSELQYEKLKNNFSDTVKYDWHNQE